jgi:DNA-nicking Smr family endonuclease
MSHVEPAPPTIDAHTLHDPLALFRHVAGDVAPIKDKNLAHVARPLPAPLPRKREADEREVLREALETPLTFEDRLDTGDEAAYLRIGLPRRVLTDLRRGRWVVQGELDLHGLTRDEARASLARFIAASLQQGRRCLRIIHGKGHGSPGRMPVLKHLSRGWLAQREDILAFCQARPHDGGDGALLVLLQAGGGNG